MKAALNHFLHTTLRRAPMAFLVERLTRLGFGIPAKRAPRLTVVGTPDPEPSARPVIGLALSSGAAKGLAHIGVIQILEEEGIPVHLVAGASMGAYVGGLWAGGQDGRQLARLAALQQHPLDRLDLLDPVFPPRRGFIRGHRIANRLRLTLGHTRIETLDRDLFIVATELETFRRKIFREGDLVDAIRASIAIPGICIPVHLDGVEYIDGGISDPLPVDVLQGKADVIIAVSVVPSVEELEQLQPEVAESRIPPSILKLAGGWLNQHLNYFARGNLLDILRRAAFASQIRLIERSARKADVFIHAPYSGAGWHDYHNAPHYIEHGRRAALEALPAIRHALAAARKRSVPSLEPTSLAS